MLNTNLESLKIYAQKSGYYLQECGDIYGLSLCPGIDTKENRLDAIGVVNSIRNGVMLDGRYCDLSEKNNAIKTSVIDFVNLVMEENEDPKRINENSSVGTISSWVGLALYYLNGHLVVDEWIFRDKKNLSESQIWELALNLLNKYKIRQNLLTFLNTCLEVDDYNQELSIVKLSVVKSLISLIKNGNTKLSQIKKTLHFLDFGTGFLLMASLK